MWGFIFGNSFFLFKKVSIPIRAENNSIFIIRLSDKNEIELGNSKSHLESLVVDRTSELNEQKLILEAQNKEKEVLLQEVLYRVKNNLQMIVSLINLQMA